MRKIIEGFIGSKDRPAFPVYLGGLVIVIVMLFMIVSGDLAKNFSFFGLGALGIVCLLNLYWQIKLDKKRKAKAEADKIKREEEAIRLKQEEAVKRKAEETRLKEEKEAKIKKEQIEALKKEQEDAKKTTRKRTTKKTTSSKSTGTKPKRKYTKKTSKNKSKDSDK